MLAGVLSRRLGRRWFGFSWIIRGSFGVFKSKFLGFVRYRSAASILTEIFGKVIPVVQTIKWAMPTVKSVENMSARVVIVGTVALSGSKPILSKIIARK